MTLVQLRHLIALADQASFSKAALAAHVSQPALSRSIRALEDELSLPLVDRIGRRVELTVHGRDALERARQIVFDADELRARGQRIKAHGAGTLRIGMGSGPGAMLMTALLQKVCADHGRLRLEITRSGTELLVQSLRAKALDGLVVDARSLKPAPDLRAEFVHEMRGAFMVRRGHPLARRRGTLGFDALRAHPIASTPLSDEVARLLVERYGPQAHPQSCVTLRCDELSSLIELARTTDAVLLAVRAAAPDLAELKLAPPLDATARFGLVTLARRTESPALDLVRRLMQQRLHD
ncbi:MAG: LysR family transcriptional regulator [Aquincola sp.]|nr:LysR family transcriptional regulator [Aquincola sp.]MDH4288904.1 LysR family transcriptional regulator [Aquincola sp.]MDH5330519.1 LysR family transcriptional regulator [Aquincola sp.]